MTMPIPRSPSRSAEDAVSEMILISGLAFIEPSLSHLMYQLCGLNRMTPCVSTPRRSAMTRAFAATSASLLGTPNFSKEATKRRRNFLWSTRVSASVDDSIGFSLCDACSPITLKSFSVRAAPFATWKGDTLYRDLAAQAKKWNSPSATDESGTKLNEYLSSHCRFSCSGRSRPRVEERADFRFP